MRAAIKLLKLDSLTVVNPLAPAFRMAEGMTAKSLDHWVREFASRLRA